MLCSDYQMRARELRVRRKQQQWTVTSFTMFSGKLVDTSVCLTGYIRFER